MFHPAHIHIGDTEDGGAIYVSLASVNDNNGQSTTLIKTVDATSPADAGEAVSYEELIAFDGYINIHESAENLAIVVANGEVGTNADGNSEED